MKLPVLAVKGTSFALQHWLLQRTECTSKQLTAAAESSSWRRRRATSRLASHRAIRGKFGRRNKLFSAKSQFGIARDCPLIGSLSLSSGCQGPGRGRLPPQNVKTSCPEGKMDGDVLLFAESAAVIWRQIIAMVGGVGGLGHRHSRAASLGRSESIPECADAIDSSQPVSASDERRLCCLAPADCSVDSRSANSNLSHCTDSDS
jgi:hypothetical protein